MSLKWPQLRMAFKCSVTIYDNVKYILQLMVMSDRVSIGFISFTIAIDPVSFLGENDTADSGDTSANVT